MINTLPKGNEKEHRRLQQVLDLLKDGQPHKAGEMAYVLGVHSRTVRRALHELRDEKGLPIGADRRGFVLKT